MLNSKYPYHYSQLTIKYNVQDFETKVNEVTWGKTKYENLMIGNSLISVPELDIAKDIDNIDDILMRY
ncbi:hypothetical protein [Clostridium botulinum]|uniref:hypothetical protein n=1 Tax=Clostridium botulinum TaxID=1491 RepID=UPI0007745345|nr:hypothetical protein [Clostridium botulinum]